MSDAYKYLRSARKSANLTQEFIAKACGVTRNAVTQWESVNADTRTEPSIDNLIIISKLTGSSIPKLVGIQAAEQQIQESKPIYVADTNNQIPLLTWHQASLLRNPSDLHDLKPIKQRINKLAGGLNVYALKVKDNTMLSPTGLAPSFPKGYLIHVDSEQSIINNDFVIAKLKGRKGLVFKQLKLTPNKSLLKSLTNPDSDIVDEFSIVGKVIASSYNF